MRIVFPFVLASLVASNVSGEPIRLLSLDWSSQQVITKALGILIEQQGIEVEFVHATSDAQWFLLAQGKADIQVEVWQGSMGTKYEQLVAKGFIQEGATHLAQTREEWWYPSYVEQQCPGLPRWEALKSCASVFAEHKGGKGIYYTGPWEKPDAARIRALELNLQVHVLPDGESINKKIHSYVKANRPLLIFNWSPNWVEAKYDGSFVEFPPYSKECEFEPEWGVNSKFNWDCGNPKGGWLKTAVSNELKEKSLCAFDIVSTFKLTNQHVASAALLADVEKLSVNKAALEWLDRFASEQQDWLNHSSCKPL